MDWFSASMLAVGFLFGFVTKALKKKNGSSLAEQRQRNRDEEALKPRCLCSHFYNSHEPGGGKCAERALGDNDLDFDWERIKPKKKEPHQCPCQGYLGPDPLASALWMGTTLKEGTK